MPRNSVSRRSLLSVFFVPLAVAAMLLALMSRAANAEDKVPIKADFTVQAEVITDITSCALGDAKCTACLTSGGFYIEAQGIGHTSLGTLFMEIKKCFYPNGGQFGTYAGAFTMTAPNGKDSITGTYSGQNDNAGDAYGFGPFSGVLTITDGTGKFEDARGTATFTAIAGPITAGPSPNTGTLMAFYSIEGNLGIHDAD